MWLLEAHPSFNYALVQSYHTRVIKFLRSELLLIFCAIPRECPGRAWKSKGGAARACRVRGAGGCGSGHDEEGRKGTGVREQGLLAGVGGVWAGDGLVASFCPCSSSRGGGGGSRETGSGTTLAAQGICSSGWVGSFWLVVGVGFLAGVGLRR